MNIAANMAKLEEELQKQIEEGEAAQPEPAEAVTDPAPANEPENQEDPAAVAVEDEHEDEEVDAASDDVKKRANAFAKARHEKKELREALEKERAERQALAERLAKLEGKTEALAKPEAKKEEEDPEPDKIMYPEDHLTWKNRQLEKKLEALEKTAQSEAQYNQHQRELQGMQALEADYKASNPGTDYDGALKYLTEKERAIKKAMNPEMTDVQINKVIAAEKLQFFRARYSEGKDPVAMIVNLAKTHGYTGEAPKADPKPKVDLAKVADNQRRGANLIGGSPAAKDTGKPTGEQILAMSMFGKGGLASLNAANPSAFDNLE